MKNFMKHYKFSGKKAEMVSTMRKEYSSNLFKVCDFKNVIDVVYECLNAVLGLTGKKNP